MSGNYAPVMSQGAGMGANYMQVAPQGAQNMNTNHYGPAAAAPMIPTIHDMFAIDKSADLVQLLQAAQPQVYED